MKLIINADDCGRTKDVNHAIEEYINLGLVTSSTIMANMEDFEGAKKMYFQYKESISFGLHLNLTEGQPLTESQVLLDRGFYKQLNGKTFFNNTNSNNNLDALTKQAVFKEIETQLIKLLDNHITPSHLDSHQFVHFRPSYLNLWLQLGRKYHIKFLRRNYNLGEFYSFPNEIFKLFWPWYVYIYNFGCKSTNFFSNIPDFFNFYNQGKYKEGATFEVMCHPGHRDRNVLLENEMLKERKVAEKFRGQLINYNSL